MNERSEMIDWIRGEVVGPGRILREPSIIEFTGREFADPVKARSGTILWQPSSEQDLEEVVYFEREMPNRKYGAGLLHPAEQLPDFAQAALQESATGTDSPSADLESAEFGEEQHSAESDTRRLEEDETNTQVDEFEIASPDVWHPSTMGISFCVRLGKSGEVVIRFPLRRRFAWQTESAQPFALNGRYELCKRIWSDGERQRESPIWRRVPAVSPDATVTVQGSELLAGHVIRKNVPVPEGSPIRLVIEVFPRTFGDQWLLTVVLRNVSVPKKATEARECVLYQTFFEVSAADGELAKYPESQRPFDRLDGDEQSLALLYRESATWGIGHGCAAGWDAGPEEIPTTLFADVFPAVQLPSMTPDIDIDGVPIKLSMRELAELPETPGGGAWTPLEHLAQGYADWIAAMRSKASGLPPHLVPVATRHLDACEKCLGRIRRGIDLLKEKRHVRQAFRLANLAVLLQQIATKQLRRRSLAWDAVNGLVALDGTHQSPWSVFERKLEDCARLGTWRAFQIAFLLMSLDGTHDGTADDRDVVDLIWFPTGGGKTEAYLAVIAFYLFHERFLSRPSDSLRRDGTNVLMRYTLRMLTTQQFQRAASLICAMEFLRRFPDLHGLGQIVGARFALGLWIGGDGSPNRIDQAKMQLADFRSGGADGNPLVLTECPWCRSEIGRYEGPKPRRIERRQWNAMRVSGVTDNGKDGPLLHCPDPGCEFGQESSSDWLPVEVIDERIFAHPPSLVIATADKLATMSFRPEAGALFGRRHTQNEVRPECFPPGLIIQDELHLISGPLGTLYALYEAIFEKLSSLKVGETWIKPKIIASTATIRGAAEQVKSLYARQSIQLFPSPGLAMSDSFFGRYARSKDGKLRDGRLYVGIHANDYGSVLTTEVRAFSSALFRPWAFASERRDPWWTLLAFYNSIRELGGARTLFDSDIRSRLKFLFNREGFDRNDRRKMRPIEEMTSRLSQPQIVKMMDLLGMPYDPAVPKVPDACLASNIIEVGVDIERLSLMAVVGQPKSTATYIQVTGRVGRRWWERPGLILTIYSPSKSRDRSHFEQFHSYHRRLYERVEPTSATPFAVSSIQRGLPGALITWARQCCSAPVNDEAAYRESINFAYDLLVERSNATQDAREDRERSLAELARVRDDLVRKWQGNPQKWEAFPQQPDGEYLMLWPGQYRTAVQLKRGVVVPSSMRQVDRTAELTITQGYDGTPPAATGESQSNGPQNQNPVI